MAGPDTARWRSEEGRTSSTLWHDADLVSADTDVTPSILASMPPANVAIRFDRTAALLKRCPSSKESRNVLSCRSGRLADSAARVLVKAGFTDVISLAGEE